MSRGVLVVDDDPFIRKLVTTTLEDVSRFELLEAGDGVEALEVARRQPPRSSSSTSTCRAWTGSTTCRELRADPATSGATIVMLTAAHGDRIEAAPRRPAPTCS